MTISVSKAGGSNRPFSPEPKLIKLSEVQRITGGLSKSQIYKLIREDKFPKQVPVGNLRYARWSNVDVYMWIESPEEYVSRGKKS